VENKVDTQAKQQYAISNYHNTKEIYTKLDHLVSLPLRPVKREKMQEFLSYFENQCKRSKALTDEAKKYIPGGVQHNLAFN
jgi:glutamate-1-semialdehyde 2,1-aminomutase